MSWIDDLALWAAGPDPDDGDGDGGEPAGEREAVWSRPVSRRAALTVFGGTATALATGTLGAPVAEAATHCSCPGDPPGGDVSFCDDGFDCCCTVSSFGVYATCCDHETQSCVDDPGRGPINGVQPKNCCAVVCAHECCPSPDDICSSTGRCIDCSGGEKCGTECCEDGTHCAGSTCVCDSGGPLCNGECCASGEDCVDDECVPGCPEGRVHCGDSTCCETGQFCVGGTCSDCADGQDTCGATCCDEGEYCCDADRGICCRGGSVCTEEFLTCICPSGSCMCGGTDDCCGPSEVCVNPSSSDFHCESCPPDHVGCGTHCCPPGAVCQHADYSGSRACGGVCTCPSGGVMCASGCCAANESCVDGVCQKCPPGTDACGPTCCAPPFVCTFDQCECPDGTEPCPTGCCEKERQELGEDPAKATVPNAVEVDHGTVPIVVACSGGCSGTVTLEAAVAQTSVLGLISRKPKVVVLGKASFKVAKGRKSKKVPVHLSHAGTRYLTKHHGHLKVRARVRTKGVKKGFLSRAFTLRAPKRKKK